MHKLFKIIIDVIHRSFNIILFKASLKKLYFNFFPRNKEDRSTIFTWDMCSDSTKLRLLVLIIGFSICFIGLSYRLVIVASNNYTKPNSNYAKNNNFRKEIVDRNGTLLAVNLPSSSLYVNPLKAIYPAQSLEKLKSIWPSLDSNKLLSEINLGKSFLWIKRDITPKEQERVFNLGLPGFDFEYEQKRIYLFGKLLSHIVGYVGRDFVGLAGIEKKFDKFLTNSDPLLDKSELSKPLELSIDIRLQSILEEEIDRTMTEFRAIGAVGIIANPHNGEILAMVSKPDFDPHQPYKASPEELFNRASLGVYETGSVFKALTMAIGFDTNTITMQDAYDVSYFKVGNFQIKDYHPHQGWQTIPEIFLHSSNIGVGQIVLEMGENHLKNYFKNLGLFDQLQIELPERGFPLYPSRNNKWSDLGIVTMSYGYGLAITPLHFVQAIIPTINGGNFYPLTIIKQPENSVPTATRIFSEQSSESMRKLLRVSVQEGTAKVADVKGYLVGGKTGTREILDGRKYVKNKRASSFIAILPASDPQFVMYVMFDEPKGTKESFGFATGRYVAAPTVQRVFERLVALYSLKPIDPESEKAQKVINVNFRIGNEV